MSSKKIALEVKFVKFMAASSALLAAARGDWDLAVAILEQARLRIPPDVLVAIWNEVVAREFKDSPGATFIVERVTLYDDGSALAIRCDVKLGEKNRQREPSFAAGKSRLDVNLN